MNVVKILDCTLRDGGYLLESIFGKDSAPRFGCKNIKKIATHLSKANLDIVEIGGISTSVQDKSEISVFKTVEALSKNIPAKRLSGQKFALMVPEPDYPVENIPEWNSNYCDILRVILRYTELKKSLDWCKLAAQKGYEVFLQPMVTMRYTDDDLRMVFDVANEMRAGAVYIVDSYGYMNQKDVLTLFEKFDKNLDKSIQVGLHLHNNLNLAFSNAIYFLARDTGRPLIIDSTVLGMGQGAGNLQTELFVDYVNKNHEKKYNYDEILETCEIIEKIWGAPLWGYSVTHLLGAINAAAYKFAEEFRTKYALSFVEIHRILRHIPEEYRHRYTPEFAKEVLRLNGYANKLA
jgi:4-hydroxy 2-oxovalerate aldolase